MNEARAPKPTMFRRVVGALLGLLAISKDRPQAVQGRLEKSLAWKPGKHETPKPMRKLRLRIRGNWRARRAARMAMQKESRRVNRRETSRNWQ